jgi:hypothetical protein
MILECYPLLKKIQARPSLWTGDDSLTSLSIYLSGYYDALQEFGLVQTRSTKDPFFDWVADKLGYKESTAGWANMILAYSMGLDTTQIIWADFLKIPISKQEHINAVSLFYDLVEEFKEEVANGSVLTK